MTENFNHWERRVISLVRRYGRLIQEHRDNEVVYFVDGFGKVGGEAPGNLIARNILIPASDGLFQGIGQTYTLASEGGNAA